MADDRRQYEGSFPIYFEEEELPENAYCIDILGMYGILSDMPRETNEWLWKFTICKGRERSDDSATIIAVADEVLDLIHADPKKLLRQLQERDRSYSKDDISDWVTVLETIKRIAVGRKTCVWCGGDLA